MGGRDVSSRAETRIGSFPSLPLFERLAPPPVAPDVAAEIEAWTRPGEVVVDLAGRGGWIARSAVAAQRRAADYETNPLTRLLAEVVLRPPDVRHLDASVQAIGAAGFAGSSVRSTIEALFASRCPGCGRTIPLESLIWEATGSSTRAVRREYRCQACHDQFGGPDLRHADPEQGDLELALSLEPDTVATEAIRRRFPVPRPDHPLPGQLLGLHTPRQLLGLHAILDRIEAELRAAPITAALRLSLLLALQPASRLNSYPGRPASLRIQNGVLKPPSGTQWRERNPWLAFEDGYRTIRGFVQRLDAGEHGTFARFGSDLLALEEGTANVALGEATASNLRRLSIQGERIAMSGRPSRVRLALVQPPLRWTPERIAMTYHATAWILGPDAAALLPLDALFSPAQKPQPEDDIVGLARSLHAAAPALAPAGRAVVLLESHTPEALVAAAIGAEAAGYRVVGARLGGSVTLVPPGGVLAPGPRTRANRPLPPVPGGSGDPGTIPGRGIFGAPEKIDDGPYRPNLAAQAVTETAVELLKARGEPATFDQLLGDVLVGLDRSGQLARLARRWRPAALEEPGLPWTVPGAGATVTSAFRSPDDTNAHRRPAAEPSRATPAPGATAGGSEAAADDGTRPTDGTAGSTSGATTPTDGTTAAAAAHGNGATTPEPAAEPNAVEALLNVIRGELDSPLNRRIKAVGTGQYWLASTDDKAEASAPIADRVEWAAFGLLSASRQLTEATFFERMAALFPRPDSPDEELLRAVLASYQTPTSGPDAITCADRLEVRSMQHDEMIAELAEVGHKMGLRVWIGRRQQDRRVHGRPLAVWLDDDEVRPHLPLVARGPEPEVERIDCAWYIPHRLSFLFEVEWTAMLGDPILVRHPRIPTDENVVRFLVVPPERAALIQLKLDRSPLLRQAMEEGNWHILKWNHLREFAAAERPSLEALEPYLGLESAADRAGEQLPLFEA